MAEDISFVEKLEKVILMKMDNSKNWSMEFLADFMAIDSKEILDYYTNSVNQSFKLLVDFIVEGQKSGVVSPNLNIDYVIWSLKMQMTHFNSPELKSMFGNAEEMIKQISQIFVYGISPVKSDV